MKEGISKEKAEAVFREQSPYVYRIALFLSGSRALADDITQETFIRVFRNYHKFDTGKPIHPWIYKITLNTTRNMLRKQNWLYYVGEVPEKSDLTPVDNELLESEEKARLWSEINQLTLKDREVIVLHFYCGMKLKELSDILEIPVGTCKSRLNHGLRALRSNLCESDFTILKQGGDICETV